MFPRVTEHTDMAAADAHRVIDGAMNPGVLEDDVAIDIVIPNREPVIVVGDDRGIGSGWTSNILDVRPFDNAIATICIELNAAPEAAIEPKVGFAIVRYGDPVFGSFCTQADEGAKDADLRARRCRLGWVCRRQGDQVNIVLQEQRIAGIDLYIVLEVIGLPCEEGSLDGPR